MPADRRVFFSFLLLFQHLLSFTRRTLQKMFSQTKYTLHIQITVLGMAAVRSMATVYAVIAPMALYIHDVKRTRCGFSKADTSHPQLHTSKNSYSWLVHIDFGHIHLQPTCSQVAALLSAVFREKNILWLKHSLVGATFRFCVRNHWRCFNKYFDTIRGARAFCAKRYCDTRLKEFTRLRHWMAAIANNMFSLLIGWHLLFIMPTPCQFRPKDIVTFELLLFTLHGVSGNTSPVYFSCNIVSNKNNGADTYVVI